MTEHDVTAEDAALRQRITELGVHIPCGMLRGPAAQSHVYGRWGKRWQSCSCEDNPVTWVNCDVSRQYDLCIICFRATAGGTSRWSWRACDGCRGINEAVARRVGSRPFALGRHSIMNGIGVRGGQPPEVVEHQLARLVAFAQEDGRLRRWHTAEYRRLAAAFDATADVPLREWQEKWPPGGAACRDAFSRLLDYEL